MSFLLGLLPLALLAAPEQLNIASIPADGNRVHDSGSFDGEQPGLHVENQPPAAGDYNVPDARNAGEVDPRAMPVPPPCLPPDEFARRLQAGELPSVLVLTASRDIPLWRNDSIPTALEEQLSPGHRPSLAVAARPGEFLVFQLGVVPVRANLASFDVEFSGLTGDRGTLPAEAFRCVTLGGIGSDGKAFRKTISVPARTLQAVWIGVEVPNLAAGVFRGQLRLMPAGEAPIAVPLNITVSGDPVVEQGTSDAWRLARLKWLDSNIGREPVLPKGFVAVRVDGPAISIQGHRIVLDSTGLPERIESTYSGSNTRFDGPAGNLLARPIRFVAQTAEGILPWRPGPETNPTLESACVATWPIRAEADGLRLTGGGTLAFDGRATLRLQITAQRDLSLSDLRLEIPYAETAACYFMGLGHPGGARPAALAWNWNVTDRHQDGFWMGAVNNGAAWKFHDQNYQTPLVNIYYPFRRLVLPASWDNDGRGGIGFDAPANGAVVVRSFSGPREMRAGETLFFDVDLNLTPSKPIATDEKWRDRIVHPVRSPAIETALSDRPASGATIINLHHGTELNPFINYPYGDAALPLLADFIHRAHEQDARVKVYYTTRELTVHVPELWALLGLNGEIICPGPGAAARTVTNKNGPDPWLVEHLGPGFIPAWRTTLDGRFAGTRDLAVITTPDSRWNNFYLEGLDFLCRQAQIDGIYLDDTALDRESLLRARRILERERPAPHIDLHSWNHFKPLGALANSALLYLELMPFLDRLWLGEGFNYDQPPDYWLVEVAGIPYGVMSEMLQGGGNPWRGMLFGMTSRLGPPKGHPLPIWHYWDQFGMNGTELIGWWDEACPVRTDRPQVLATVYRKPGRALVALASWSPQDQPAKLVIDWQALGLDAGRARAQIAAIDGFQSAAAVDLGQPISVPAGRGLLIEIVER